MVDVHNTVSFLFNLHSRKIIFLELSDCIQQRNSISKRCGIYIVIDV